MDLLVGVRGGVCRRAMQQKGWLGGTDGAGTEAELLQLPSHLHRQDSEPENGLTDASLTSATRLLRIKQQHDRLKPTSLLTAFHLSVCRGAQQEF